MSAILALHMSTSRSKPALDLRRVEAGPEVERWWDVLLKSLSKQGVGERSLVWHRRRVEQLARRQPGLPIKAFTAQAVTGHLTAMDGLGLPAWQLLQAVDAIERFGRYVRAPWVSGVDWTAWRDRWSDAADEREMAVLEDGCLPTDPLFRRFALRLRARRYSLRTERTYID